MYIGPKSRTERLRKTKTGTEVGLVVRDSDTTFKVKRSTSPDRFTHQGVNTSGSCSGERGNLLLRCGLHSAGAVSSVARGTSAPTYGGDGQGHIAAAARLQLVLGRLSLYASEMSGA